MRRRGQQRRGGTPLFPGITEQEITDSVTSVLLSAGLPVAYVHAWEKCGFLVTETNAHMWDDDDIEEWNDALAEGERIYGPVD